jgi:hypothetical protein
VTSVAAKVAKHKEAHPELYCPFRKCLWKTGGGYCPRHADMNRCSNCGEFLSTDHACEERSLAK